MDWNQTHKLLDVQAAALTGDGGLGAENTVDQFGDRHRRKREIERPVSAEDALNKVRDGLLPAFSGDHGAGVQH
jgi:hypothetical protein